MLMVAHVCDINAVQASLVCQTTFTVATLAVTPSPIIMALFDEAMETVGGADWVWSRLLVPKVEKKHAGDIQTPVSLEDFCTSALRPTVGVRSAWACCELIKDVPEQSEAVLGRILAEGASGVLPPCLNLAAGKSLPHGANQGMVCRNNADGTMTVLRVILFASPVLTAHAASLVPGEALVPVSRPGPWAVKKAFQWLLSRVAGFHISWASVTQKDTAVSRKGSAEDIPDDEIDEGVDFIMQKCPTDESEGEMSKWIWKCMKQSSGSKIAGWPEQRIRRIAENKRKASTSAPVQRFFPLTTMDLKPVWHKTMLPYMIPILLECGILLLGQPGVGKTPFFIALAMAFGRFRHSTRGGGAPGWRRGKSWDDFRDRESEITVAAFLDDPTLPSLDLADVKNFLTGDTGGTTRARYNDPRFVANQLKGLADNETDEQDEPFADNRTTIRPEEFWSMIQKPFGYAKKTHILAILKRVITVYAGKNAVYVRLPHKSESGLVHRITEDDVTQDWLQHPGNKCFYGKFKNGLRELPPNFEENVELEQKMFMDAVAAKGDMLTEAYVDQCNTNLQKDLCKAVPATPSLLEFSMQVVEEDKGTQESLVIPHEADGSYHIPVATVGVSSSSSSLRSRFVLPGERPAKRRITGKRKAGMDDSEGSIESEPDN